MHVTIYESLSYLNQKLMHNVPLSLPHEILEYDLRSSRMHYTTVCMWGDYLCDHLHIVRIIFMKEHARCRLGSWSMWERLDICHVGMNMISVTTISNIVGSRISIIAAFPAK